MIPQLREPKSPNIAPNPLRVMLNNLHYKQRCINRLDNTWGRWCWWQQKWWGGGGGCGDDNGSEWWHEGSGGDNAGKGGGGWYDGYGGDDDGGGEDWFILTWITKYI